MLASGNVDKIELCPSWKETECREGIENRECRDRITSMKEVYLLD